MHAPRFRNIAERSRETPQLDPAVPPTDAAQHPAREIAAPVGALWMCPLPTDA